jgi:hypothetical protein
VRFACARLTEWLREPLLHFLVLGSGLFLLFQLANRGEVRAPDEIVVTRGTIEHLAATFTRTWQRPPTPQELDGLVDDYVREEVFYREATSLGLDRGDTIIRRRLRQKMEFIADDVAALAAPSDETLRSFFATHAESYREPSRYTFRHVFFDPGRHPDRLQAEIDAALTVLNGTPAADPAALGDRLLLAASFSAAAERDVAASFGEEFAEQLRELPIGRWVGPIPSGYGVHLVRLDERIVGEIPPFDDVRDAVERDWTHERRQQAIDDLFQERLRHYTVRIEAPETVGPPRVQR